MNPQEQFLAMLTAAIMDAATECNPMQFQATFTPPGQIVAKVLRVTVVPDEIDSFKRRDVDIGNQDAFLHQLVDAFQDVATKRNHVGNSVIRQLTCTLAAGRGTVKVRFIVAPEAMDIEMNPHLDPRIGD